MSTVVNETIIVSIIVSLPERSVERRKNGKQMADLAVVKESIEKPFSALPLIWFFDLFIRILFLVEDVGEDDVFLIACQKA